jgi:hypothetical protein
VGIAVDVFGLGEEGDVAGGGVGSGEFFQDGEVGRARLFGLQILDGFQAGHADEVGRHLAVVEVATVVADGAVDGQTVFQAGEIVLRAVTGSGVDAAGAAVGGDIVGENDWGGAIDKRVTGREFFERGADDGVNHFGGRRQLGRVGDGGEEGLGDQDAFRAQIGHGVFSFWMHRDREVGGDGPRGGGPDDDAEGLVGRQAELRGLGDGDEEFYPDGDGGVLGILDLGLG